MILNSTCVYIPARGGSKGIPNKNLKLFAGKPLVYWITMAASQSASIDSVVVGSDSDEILSVVLSFGLPKVDVFRRSPDNCKDTSSTESALIEFATKHQYQVICLAQATSPLTKSIHFDRAVSAVVSGEFESTLTAVKQKRFIWSYNHVERSAEPCNYDPQSRPLRQEWEGYFVENGALYASKRDSILKSGCRISGRIGLIEMEEDSYIELDTEEDWRLLESFVNSKV